MNPPSRLIVFLKEPNAGQVKTRLAEALGKAEAAALYRAFLEDALEWTSRFPAAERVACFAPADAEPRNLQALLPSGSEGAFRFEPQQDGDLGARLAAAFRSALAPEPGRPCLVVGTDCPLLGPSHLRAGLEALGSADLVLTPALDGGYCMIGLRRHHSCLFRDVPWSTERVLEVTLERAASAGLEVALTPPVRDVDTIRDLWALREEILAASRDPAREAFPERTYRRLLQLAPR